MNPHKTNSTTWALLLIAVAIAGAGVSYHFTLESRFASIEEKLDQNSVALQQYQISQETIISAKTETLNNLNKEVDSLQSSLEPLGKATQEQTDSLSQIHKQIVSLEQSQQAQQDAQKKLADYASQLDQMKHDIQRQTQAVQAQTVQAQAGPVSTPAPLTTPAAAPTPVMTTPQAYSANVPLPLPPRAEGVVDLRPAQTTAIADDASVRALPVALPVGIAPSDVR